MDRPSFEQLIKEDRAARDSKVWRGPFLEYLDLVRDDLRPLRGELDARALALVDVVVGVLVGDVPRHVERHEVRLPAARHLAAEARHGIGRLDGGNARTRQRRNCGPFSSK